MLNVAGNPGSGLMAPETCECLALSLGHWGVDSCMAIGSPKSTIALLLLHEVEEIHYLIFPLLSLLFLLSILLTSCDEH